MSGGKWQTVGRRDQRKGRKDQLSSHDVKYTVAGLSEAQSAFSRFSELDQGTGSKEEVTHQHQAHQHQTASRRRVRRAKGEEKQRPTFEDSARELDTVALTTFVEEAQDQFLTSPQGWLKELAGYLQGQFSGVEPEKDFAFASTDPGYPATGLMPPVRDMLLSHLRLCPQLSLQWAFRDTLDSMLAEVKGGVASYGSRIMLGLLVECSPELCAEAVERVSLLLQSCLNRVPEALSLLWAGTPHPKLHPSHALGVWPTLYLPLLYRLPNVPRPVVAFVIEHSTVLLRHLNHRDCARLPSLLPPSTVCVLLTSSPITTKRTQRHVQEFCKLLQERLLQSCSTDRCTGYFSACLQQLDQTQAPEVLLSLAIGCLCHSTECLTEWQRLFSTHPQPSLLLLSHIHSNWEELVTTLPLSALHATLRRVEQWAGPQQRALCKALIEASRSEREEGGGSAGWREGLGKLLVWGAVLCCLSLLAVVLTGVAREGPGRHWEMLESNILRHVHPSEAVELMWWCLAKLTGLFVYVNAAV